ncbi:MAG: hypothetical protein Q8L98_08835 [Chlamydiales bacterium]|nr:hypothetical protein [Chlamydiales bacterium]
MDTKSFVQRLRSLYLNSYIYTKTVFKDWKTKVAVTCPKHGDFYSIPQSLINGHGCKNCAVELQGFLKAKKAAAEFEVKARATHEDKYDYSQVKYKNAHTLVEISCNIHGSFFQRPYAHLQGSGCMKCGIISTAKKRTISLEGYIEKAKQKHGEKYDYSKTVYVSNREFILITCFEHGDFSIRAGNHLTGQGCVKCGAIKRVDGRRDTKEVFVKKANEIHNNRYEYTSVIYKGSHFKVVILCPDCGPFLQKPSDHLGSKSGCPLCVNQLNSRGVKKIVSYLLANNLKFEREKTFSSLKSAKAGNKSLRFDFYIQEFKTLIEFDGLQHFKPIAKWGGEKTYKALKENDELKNEWAAQEGFKLVRIKYTEEEVIEKILSDLL